MDDLDFIDAPPAHELQGHWCDSCRVYHLRTCPEEEAECEATERLFRFAPSIARTDWPILEDVDEEAETLRMMRGDV